MSEKRKKKLREREARRANLHRRHQNVQRLSGAEVSIHREIDYIVRCAAAHDARCVTLNDLTFFSTETGDAWLLDAGDGQALCLARDGVAQPVRVFETDKIMAVEWDSTFSISGDHFTTMEKSNSRVTTVTGYPTQAILALIQKAKELRG